jgi:4-amino-4-deoxy-L-arabinose transferase-like glycosyltransferase
MQNFLVKEDYVALAAKEYCWLKILLAATVVLKILFIFNSVLNSDGALYAQVGFNMSHSRWYLLTIFGHDWLDKPHLLFWINAALFNLFTPSVLIYNLSATCALLLGGYFTYCIAKLFYDKVTALLSVIIYFNFIEINLSIVSPKLEPYLIVFITASVFFWLKFVLQNQPKYFVIACIFSALAVMTKGFFVLVIIFSPLAFMYFYMLFNPEVNYLGIKNHILLKLCVALGLILIFSIPDILAFWLQFGYKGIKFFFWDSQFGRFGGELITKGADKTIFRYYSEHLLTLLVDLLLSGLPFIFIFIYAIIEHVNNFRKNTKQSITDLYVIIPFITMLIIFSVSRFYNSYYAAILMPFIAIYSARFMYRNWNCNFDKFNKSMAMLAIILIVLVILSNLFLFNLVILVVAIVGLLGLILSYSRFSNLNLRSFIFLTLSINIYFIFNVINYNKFYTAHNVGYVVGKALAKLNPYPLVSFISRDISGVSLVDNNIKDIQYVYDINIDKIAHIPCYLIIGVSDFDLLKNQLMAAKLQYKVIATFDDRDNPTVEDILVNNLSGGTFAPYKIYLVFLSH